jgi:AcrR family transcriptional regulator
MARTQAADFDQRRELIIERAVRLYAERGYLGASLADLAQACNTSKSLIYHYFPSKEDILYEAMDSHVRILLDAATTIQARDLPADEKLRALTHEFMHLYVGAADRHKVLLNELHNLPPARRDTIVKRQRKLIQIVTDLLTEIQAQLKGEHTATAATMLFFGMINWTHIWFDPRGPLSTDTLADVAADLMLHGLPSLNRPRP